MLSDAIAIVALQLTPGIGRNTIHRALAGANIAGIWLQEMLSLPPRELLRSMPAGFQQTANRIARCGPQQLQQAREIIKRVSRAGVQFFSVTHPHYPHALDLHLGMHAPPVLFAFGNMDLFEEYLIGVVGTRSPSPVGQHLAQECAQICVDDECAVVSGGAPGVDSLAHVSAVVHGGKTIIVLPQGILTWRPPLEIQRVVEEGQVLILSEFMPDTPWQTHSAVTRNATISALARLVCVVEPQKQGGSLRTARLALYQKKPVLTYVDPALEDVRRSLEHLGAKNLMDSEGRILLESRIAFNREKAHSSPGVPWLL